MHFTLFASAQLPCTPWKNGGGTTREIACLPAGACAADFQWRLSIAEIAASGPFSVFAGIDRVITLLSGDGVRLFTADGHIDHALSQPLQPFAFPGDVVLDCTLLGSTCQDFNVMVRRSFGAAQVQAQQQTWSLPAHGALLVQQGRWRLTLPDGSTTLMDASAQDGAHWSGLTGAASVHPLTADAQLLAVTITPHIGSVGP